MTTETSPATDERAATRLAPSDLAAEPGLADLLDTLGLGPFEGEVVAYPGRNPNWAGITRAGVHIFAKRLAGSTAESRRRFERVEAFERLFAGQPPRHLRWPPCLGADEPERLLVFAYLRGTRGGHDVAADDTFDDVLATEVGRALAELHQCAPAAGELDDSPPPLPSLRPLEALSMAAYLEASGAELEAWSLLQRDEELLGALEQLLAQERRAPAVPIHGDLRLDQMLIDAAGTPHFTDWEEFRLGDAARDLGAFVGEWLYRAMLGMSPDQPAADFDIDPAAAHRENMARATNELERRRPLVRAFWQGYRIACAPSDPGLATRSAGFAGWHLIDRMLAAASERPQLLAVERAAAGVGRTVVLSPAAFAGVLGLEEP